jgi:hypothetical protein
MIHSKYLEVSEICDELGFAVSVVTRWVTMDATNLIPVGELIRLNPRLFF